MERTHRTHGCVGRRGRPDVKACAALSPLPLLFQPDLRGKAPPRWRALGIVMVAVLYDPAFALVAAWFRRGRSRALTVLTFVAGFASVVYVPLAAWLVQLQGWRGALVTLAVMAMLQVNRQSSAS